MWGRHLHSFDEEAFRRLSGGNSTGGGSDDLYIYCPESIFANVESDAGGILLMLTTVVASLPIMGMGL